MQTIRSSDTSFTYVYEPGIGQTYQNCAYMIIVRPVGYSQTYAVTYRGNFIQSTETYLGAVRAVEAHEARRQQEGK